MISFPGFPVARRAVIRQEDWELANLYGRQMASRRDYAQSRGERRPIDPAQQAMSKAGEIAVYDWYRQDGHVVEFPDCGVHRTDERKFTPDVAGHFVKTDTGHYDSVVFNIGPSHKDVDPITNGQPLDACVVIVEPVGTMEYRLVAVVRVPDVPARLKPLRYVNPNKAALYFSDLTDEEKRGNLPIPRG